MHLYLITIDRLECTSNCISLFSDSTIEINGNPLGIAVANIKRATIKEIIPARGSDYIVDMCSCHYGHTYLNIHLMTKMVTALVVQIMDSKIYILIQGIHREPQSGEWPQWFSDSDIRVSQMWG